MDGPANSASMSLWNTNPWLVAYKLHFEIVNTWMVYYQGIILMLICKPLD